jgi:hypothetical protein
MHPAHLLFFLSSVVTFVFITVMITTAVIWWSKRQS